MPAFNPVPLAPGESRETAILRFINEARLRPAAFAERYIAPLAETDEDAAECLREMRKTKPLPPLRLTTPLASSARVHALDLAANAFDGHIGSDGSTTRERLARFARFKGYVAENIYFGPGDPLQTVLRLLIDPNVAGRLHRLNLLHPDIHEAGVALVPHPDFGALCVIDLATQTAPLR